MPTPSVYYFNETMRGAPVVNGQPGSLIAMLKACLIDGFGLVSASAVTITAGIAKATIPSGMPHDPDSNILVAGGSDAALNGTFRVVASDATSVSWATTASSGSGTVTIKVAPVIGWSMPFSDAGTFKMVFKSTDPQSYGMYVWIDDSNPQYARVVGYETMSGIDTGTGPFPTPARMNGGGYWKKSESNSTNPVSWLLATDSRSFYHYFATYQGNFPLTDTASRPNYPFGVLRGFGDMAALRPTGDAYACMLSYWNTQAYTGNGLLTSSGDNHLAMPREYTGLPGALNMGVRPYVGSDASSGEDPYALGVFPSPIDGILRVTRSYVWNKDNPVIPRADVPGLYRLPHNTVGVIPNRTKFNNIPGLPGKVLLAVYGGATGSTVSTTTSAGRGLIDLTGPWR